MTADRTAPLLVIADNYQQACDYAREHGLGREGRAWRYVTGPRWAYGYHGPGHYVALTIPGGPTTHVERVARHDALAYLRAHGFTPHDGAS